MRPDILRVSAAALFVFASAWTALPARAEHSTNFRITSDEVEHVINQKAEPEEKPIFYQDEKVTVGINDNGDPNVGMQF